MPSPWRLGSAPCSRIREGRVLIRSIGSMTPRSTWLARAFSLIELLCVVAIISILASMMFMPMGKALPGVIAVTVLATVGFVAIGTVFSAMVVRTRFAELMLPVLLLPFMVPPLIGATMATTRLLAGRPLSDFAGWLRFLAVYDVVFVTLSALTFWAVVDE